MDYIIHTTLDPGEVERRHYAFPEQRKFPMPDRAHVLSAIKFFNYVDPKDERHLANAILQRMRELGITNVYVGPNNRFGKYYKGEPDSLAHYGVKGMHWGVWNAETAARHAGRKAERYHEKAYNARKKAQSLDRTAFGRSNSIRQAKYKAKAAKYTKRANRSEWHPFQSPYERAKNQRKAEKYERMANGLSGKTSQVDALNAKAAKYEFKAERAERARKRYLNSISKSDLATGKNLVNAAVEGHLDRRLDRYVQSEASKAMKNGVKVDARYRSKLRNEASRYYYGHK